MYPWFWLWAPQLHLPFSGNVAQAEYDRQLVDLEARIRRLRKRDTLA